MPIRFFLCRKGSLRAAGIIKIVSQTTKILDVSGTTMRVSKAVAEDRGIFPAENETKYQL